MAVVRMRDGSAYVVDEEAHVRLGGAHYPVTVEATWMERGIEKHGMVEIDPGAIKTIDSRARTSPDPRRNSNL